MEIKGKKIMVLGGYGEVGFAVCRQLLREAPRELIITSLKKEEALEAVQKLRSEVRGERKLTPVYGNLFVR
jgi:FlaA1/EpsC-like NDP-sugar epimerase